MATAREMAARSYCKPALQGEASILPSSIFSSEIGLRFLAGIRRSCIGTAGLVAACNRVVLSRKGPLPSGDGGCYLRPPMARRCFAPRIEGGGNRISQASRRVARGPRGDRLILCPPVLQGLRRRATQAISRFFGRCIWAGPLPIATASPDGRPVYRSEPEATALRLASRKSTTS